MRGAAARGKFQIKSRSGSRRAPEERILAVMKPTRAARRRHLPTSPFEPPPPAPPVKVFGVADRVTHDKYGLGRVTEVEAHAVLVDFGARTVRILAPYAKLFPL